MASSLRRDLFRFLRGVASAHGAGLSWSYSAAKSFPFVVLERSGGASEHHTRGPSGYATASIRVTCYAALDAVEEKKGERLGAMKRAGMIADSIRHALNGFHGPMGDTYVVSSEMEGEFDGEERTPQGDGWVVGITQDYEIAYGESVGVTA